MERELIKSLIKWKASQSRKPLILKGVRQCGKTYLLKEFGARCYQDTAYFNFEENEALKTVFEKDYYFRTRAAAWEKNTNRKHSDHF